MEIGNVPFQVTNWDEVPAIEYKGDKGTSFWRVYEAGNIRVRVVEYSEGFYSDHWCPKGHVLLVLEGELKIKLKDGTESTITSGMSFQVEDDAKNPHIAFSDTGAIVFIVD